MCHSRTGEAEDRGNRKMNQMKGIAKETLIYF